jgi:hypothetical protein
MPDQVRHDDSTIFYETINLQLSILKQVRTDVTFAGAC